jgi:hypothetical protein
MNVFSAVAADEDSGHKAKVKPDAVRLKEDLLCAYDMSVRPVIFHGNATFVFVSMILRSLSYVGNSAAANLLSIFII